LDLRAHHLIYGKIKDEDIFNWLKKAEVALVRAKERFDQYSREFEVFYSDFISFLSHPRRFTYTPLILCKGRKPH
jgi:hypothetical protein